MPYYTWNSTTVPYSASHLADEVTSLSTLVSNNYTPQRAGHAWLYGPTEPLVMELLLLSFAAASPGQWNSLPPHLKR